MGKTKKVKNKRGKDGNESRPTSSDKYHVGAMGDVIAQSCGVSEAEFDTKLVSVFSNPKKSFSVKAVEAEAMPTPPARNKIDINKKNPRKEDGELKNKDAASIRIGVKAKFATFNSVKQPSSLNDSQPKKLKRLQIGKKRTEDGKKLRHKPRQTISTVDTLKVHKKELKTESTDHDVASLRPDLATTQNNDSETKPSTRMTTQEKKENKSGSVGEIKKSVKELNAPKDKDPELEARTLFVGNVPKSANKKQILKLFNGLGDGIETVRLRCAAPDKPTASKKVAMNKKELHPDRDSIAAYIRFSSREKAEKVIDKAHKDGLMLADHHLTLDMADRSVKRDNKKGIFIGNLPLKTQDDEVWNLFAECGQIESVRVVRDRETGLGKGFGYVNFMERSCVELALKKDGSDFNNRPLRISRCVKKLKKIESGHVRISRGIKSKFDNNQAKQKSFSAAEGHTNNVNNKKQSKKVSQGMRQRESNPFAGHMTVETGKFKRNSKKPNREDIKKERMAKKLVRSVFQSKNAEPGTSNIRKSKNPRNT